MAETLTIQKNNHLPPAEDYNFLRREGIRLIEQLSGRVWTDYNTHDPGITLVEALCYTLTDLAYRTGFAVKDLLSTGKGPAENPETLFYTARQILPCNPVTLPDYRKLVIDTQGVRNAWVEPGEDYEILLYLEAKEGAGDQPGYTLGYGSGNTGELLRLRGLYKVYVEYDPDVLAAKREEEVNRVIRQKLDAHRNLGEDFLSITSIEYEDFRIEAELQVSEGSDIEKINAQLFRLIQDFFSPPVAFYTLEQMVEKGYTTEEIFDGPVLKYGFIDTRELARSERQKEIHLSDIMARVLELEGVIAIRKFALPLESQTPGADFSQWVSDPDRQKAPRLDVDNSIVSFVRSGDRHRSPGTDRHPVRERVKAMLNFLQSASLKSKLKGPVANDFPVPAGEFMQVSEYFPLQGTLPANYGMTEQYLGERRSTEQLTPETPKKEQVDRLDRRSKQALQLRGFLMVFEQLLSDYLAGLAHVRDLFSYGEPGRQAAFSSPLKGIYDLEALFIDFRAYITSLQRMAEPEETFMRRRDAMLDHLMGRFAESLGKYDAYVRTTLGRAAGPRLLEDKVAFLKDYLEISTYRGRSFDLRNREQVWDTDNVEGLKKRVCRLTGLSDYRRRFLAPDAIFIERVPVDNSMHRYVVVLTDPGDRQRVLLRSVEYEFEGEATDTLNYFLENGPIRSLYRQEGRRDRWGYQLMRATQEADQEVIATSLPFKNASEAEEAFERTLETLSSFSDHSSFHVLEHILLRPRVNAREKTGRRTPLDTDSISLLDPVDVSDLDIDLKRDKEKPTYRNRITHHRSADRSGKLLWNLALEGPEDAAVLTVDEDFPFYNHLTRRIRMIREFAADRSNWVTVEAADGPGSYRLQQKTRVLARSAKTFSDPAAMEAEIADLIRYFSYEAVSLPVEGENFDSLGYYADPYSFRISIFLPAWPAKFRDPTFRHLLEKTLYLETPSHIHPEVYWLPHGQLRELEEAYKIWLEEMANTEIPNTEVVNNLIAVWKEVTR